MELALNQTRPDKAHICRVCGKGFVSGCALGGHMRIHGVQKDLDAEEEEEEEEDTFTMTDSADGSDPYSSDLDAARIPKLTYGLRTKGSYYRNHHHWMFGSWNPIFDSPTRDHHDIITNQSSSDVINGGCALTEDEEVAQSLVMLSRGEGLVYTKPWIVQPLKELASSSGSSCRVEAAIAEQARLQQLPLMVPPIRFRSMEKMMSATTPVKEQKSQKGFFECKSCNKVFTSHQALGGHRASHRKVKGCSSVNPTKQPNNDLVINATNDSKAIVLSQLHAQEATVEPPQKKAKIHECTICHRLFATGQALGGHKRCHWLVQSSNQAAEQRHVTLAPVFSGSTEPLDLFPAQPNEQLRVEPTSSVHVSMPGLGLLTPGPVEDEVDSNKAKNERKRTLSDDRIADLGPDDWLQVGIGSNRSA